MIGETHRGKRNRSLSKPFRKLSVQIAGRSREFFARAAEQWPPVNFDALDHGRIVNSAHEISTFDPRYLVAEQVNRLIAACDGEVVARRRDRAIVLLLTRLGLRAGDVARLDDIEWETGSLRVSGKSRYEVRLPLPQDVGMRSPSTSRAALRPARAIKCFLRNIAPFRPFRKGDGISSVVKRLMQRAGIVAPVKGAHARPAAVGEQLQCRWCRGAPMLCLVMAGDRGT